MILTVPFPIHTSLPYRLGQTSIESFLHSLWLHQRISLIRSRDFPPPKRRTRRQMEDEKPPTHPAQSLGLWQTQSSSSSPIYPPSLNSWKTIRFWCNSKSMIITKMSLRNGILGSIECIPSGVLMLVLTIASIGCNHQVIIEEHG